MKRHLTALFSPAVLLAFFTSPNSCQAAPPNIVILLADDLGWADVSYHGGYVKTPNIDRLAGEGVELDRFYVCPMCSPTRAATMTGRYPIRFGLARAVIPPWRNFGLDTDEVTIADALAKAGYRQRGIFGKWHLGHHDVKWHPLSRGFTRFLGHYNGAIDYFTLEREGERDWHSDYEPSDQTGYSTNLIAAAASRFIQTAAQEDERFFCYVPFNAPHSPFQAPQKYLKQYSHLAPKEGAKKRGSAKTKQTLAAMITCMDDGIGRILKSIDQAGVRDNTIVWFFSDNGGIKAVPENNRPLRGNKLSVFEGGVRVPSCVRWPASLKPGGKATAPLSCMDILPTVLAAAGNDEVPGKPLDGLNVLPVLKGEQPNLNRDLFFYHGQAGEQSELIALTTRDWKLIILGPNIASSDFRSEKHQLLLFHIAEDPLEKKDLSAENSDVVARLATRMIEFRKLQPKNAVDPYGRERQGFKAPARWKIPRQAATLRLP
ncbi:MAG: sulfatase-like hydrolase/transferase [Planctomycetes bacterium]|nr:sulfatase-like hydrolase/transferase [Planctomycetota bacterium]